MDLYPYLSIEDLLTFIPFPNRAACFRMLEDNLQRFQEAPGSSGKHQAWRGGYLHHLTEVMNIGLMHYTMYSALRPLPFQLGDVMLVLFLHDVEKPWKYDIHGDQIHIRPEFRDKHVQHVFRVSKLLEYDFQLTPEQENALKYVEGEYLDYSPDRRVMNELAAFCHICDVASARIWHDMPTAGDLWSRISVAR